VPPQVVSAAVGEPGRLQLFIITMNERGLDPSVLCRASQCQNRVLCRLYTARKVPPKVSSWSPLNVSSSQVNGRLRRFLSELSKTEAQGSWVRAEGTNPLRAPAPSDRSPGWSVNEVLRSMAEADLFFFAKAISGFDWLDIEFR